MKPTSLRRLVDDGLLFEINRRVLHPLGLALAMQWDSEDTSGEPDRVVLLRDPDPEGTVFEAKTFEEGMAKFRAFVDREGGHKMAGREAMLGFVEQVAPLTEDSGSN